MKSVTLFVAFFLFAKPVEVPAVATFANTSIEFSSERLAWDLRSVYRGSSISLIEPGKVFEDAADCGVPGNDYALVPINRIPGAAREIARWRDIATRGEPLTCGSTDCLQMVKILPDAASNIRDGLAVCTVSKIGGTFGAPVYCKTIFLDSDKGPLVLGITRTDYSFDCSMGRPDYELVVLYPPGGGRRMEKLLNLAQFVLKSPPLSMSVELRNGSLLGTASYRPSPILEGFRELVTIRVGIDEFIQKKYYLGTGLEVSTTLYINKQNTERSKDWYLPSQAQENQYVQAVKKLLKDRLITACRRADWLDDRILSCDLPASVQVEVPPRGLRRRGG